MSTQSKTPRTDAAVIEFEYSEVMLGGEIGGGYKEMIEPEFARQLETELNDAVKQLAECFRASGADCDGNEDWRLAPRAVEAVRQLRADYDGITPVQLPPE